MSRKPELEALFRVGSLMSNVAFNLGQSSELDDNTRATLRKLAGDWDNALREARVIQRKAKPATPGKRKR